MFRSTKSAIAIAAVALTLALTGGQAAISASTTVHLNGGATGCCRTID